MPEGCPLSQHQFGVLLRLTNGLTYKQAARELDVSDTTVRSHAHNAYRLLGVSNAAGAAVVFMSHGWHYHQQAPPPPEPQRGRSQGRQPFPLPPFAPAYIDALDRHLADGTDLAAQRDLSIAAIGLTARKPAPRDRDAFLDRVIRALGVA